MVVISSVMLLASLVVLAISYSYLQSGKAFWKINKEYKEEGEIAYSNAFIMYEEAKKKYMETSEMLEVFEKAHKIIKEEKEETETCH